MSFVEANSVCDPRSDCILSLTRNRLALRPLIPTLLPNEYIGEKGARDWGQLSILNAEKSCVPFSSSRTPKRCPSGTSPDGQRVASNHWRKGRLTLAKFPFHDASQSTRREWRIRLIACQASHIWLASAVALFQLRRIAIGLLSKPFLTGHGNRLDGR